MNKTRRKNALSGIDCGEESNGAGTDTEDIDSYDVEDPYENEILDDPDKSDDSGEEDV